MLAYIAIGVLIVATIIWLRKPAKKKRTANNLNFVKIAIILAAVAVTLFLLKTGAHIPASFVGGAAVVFTFTNRLLALINNIARFMPKRAKETFTSTPKVTMSKKDASQLLDVSAKASKKEIEAAYKRCIDSYTPTEGGPEVFAEKVNQAMAARDILLRK